MVVFLFVRFSVSATNFLDSLAFYSKIRENYILESVKKIILKRDRFVPSSLCNLLSFSPSIVHPATIDKQGFVRSLG